MPMLDKLVYGGCLLTRNHDTALKGEVWLGKENSSLVGFRKVPRLSFGLCGLGLVTELFQMMVSLITE